MKKILLAAALVLAFIPAAFALDLTTPITDVDGTPAVDQLSPHKGVKCGETADFDCLTIGRAITHALLFSYKDEQPSGEDKFRRGELARKIIGADKIDFTATQVTEIKPLVGKLYGPWTIVQIYNALDPSAVQK